MRIDKPFANTSQRRRKKTQINNIRDAKGNKYKYNPENHEGIL
jgi:hypothetical protein